MRETVVGEKLPPSLASLGVTTTVPEMTPSAPAVKLEEALLAVPVVGPVRVMAVAGAETVTVRDAVLDPPSP